MREDIETDAYWVGAMAMSMAIALLLIKRGRCDLAEEELARVLLRFSETSLYTDLRDELPSWRGDTR